MIILISGIPGAGKTTIGKLISEKYAFKLIDGIDFRRKYQEDFDFSYKASSMLIDKLISFIQKSNENIVLSMVIPWKTLRKRMEEKLEDYYEIFLKANSNRHQIRKRNYQTPIVPGIDIKYEESVYADLVIDTNKTSIEETYKIISEFIDRKIMELNIKNQGGIL